MFEKQPGGRIDPKEHRCLQVVFRTLKTYHHVNFMFFPVVPNKLGKVMKYEAKKMMSIIYLELNIE